MPKIRRINYLPMRKKMSAETLKNKKNTTIAPINLIKDNGTHLTTNLKINYFTQLTLNTLDKLSPIIKKHPKFGQAIMSACEKLIKLSGKISCMN